MKRGPHLLRRAPSGHSNTKADVQRERRVALVLALVERFVYDLGLLIGGHPADLDEYVAPAAAARLRRALPPLTEGRGGVRPEFGEYAQVRVEGDLLDPTALVQSVVEFDDHSTRLGENGEPVARARRRLRLLLLFDPGITTVVDHRIGIA